MKNNNKYIQYLIGVVTLPLIVILVLIIGLIFAILTPLVWTLNDEGIKETWRSIF